MKKFATLMISAAMITAVAACDPGTETGTPVPPQATFTSTAKPLICKKGYHRVQTNSKGYSYHYKCVKDSTNKVGKKSISKGKKRR